MKPGGGEGKKPGAGGGGPGEMKMKKFYAIHIFLGKKIFFLFEFHLSPPAPRTPPPPSGTLRPARTPARPRLIFLANFTCSIVVQALR